MKKDVAISGGNAIFCVSAEVANEPEDKRNEPLVRRESVEKFHGAIPYPAYHFPNQEKKRKFFLLHPENLLT